MLNSSRKSTNKSVRNYDRVAVRMERRAAYNAQYARQQAWEREADEELRAAVAGTYIAAELGAE